jgi:hypothetical protein
MIYLVAFWIATLIFFFISDIVTNIKVHKKIVITRQFDWSQ